MDCGLSANINEVIYFDQFQTKTTFANLGQTQALSKWFGTRGCGDGHCLPVTNDGGEYLQSSAHETGLNLTVLVWHGREHM